NTQLNSVRIHILRYSEILLLLAEAYVETGNPTAARPLINQLRERAGAGAQGCGNGSNEALLELYPGCEGNQQISVSIDDPSIQWANYEIGLYPVGSFADVNYARAAVRAERRLEHAMEGTRMYDLRRWGILESTLNNYVSVEQDRREYLTAAATVEERHNRFPIPSVQIELSTVDGEQMIVQNPGW
ncbi:MAG: RagB/SusD family nutrient uptake outer membrane protein, partial [Balneolaceae bacterium]|nr:RagB/SusD family nutrient uptake outer membrane protein [Balneolaceae bacterium]